VLVRPFDVTTESVVGADVEAQDYFTPAALALLLQHMALTFAALSLVRDRSTGLFELLRIGPLSSIEILFGKCVAFLIVGAIVATALTVAATAILGVPFLGSLLWFSLMVLGVVFASLALGMALSAISATESQAVQFAMLTLLAGMFFSGFILGLDNLSYPVKLISWTLPVTYGIRSFQTIMLLGQPPQFDDIVGLAVLVVVYGAFATVSLRRSLRHA
jgi:ABC-2 type transport system permease protein